MKQPHDKEVDEFLYQSNLIEGVDSPHMLADAIEAWNYLMTEDVMTLEVILNVHSTMMRNSDLRPEEVGAFRTIPVYIGRKEMLPAKLIQPQLLMGFCFETMRASPPPDWKELHIVFETIHPFVDGNGRVGRMLMNWTRLKRCDLPLFTINFEERGDYYRWFR